MCEKAVYLLWIINGSMYHNGVCVGTDSRDVLRRVFPKTTTVAGGNNSATSVLVYVAHDSGIEMRDIILKDISNFVSIISP